MRLETALRTLRTERRVAVLHDAPVAATVEGEPKEIFPFLGSSRLAETIDRFGLKATFCTAMCTWARTRPPPTRAIPGAQTVPDR